MSRKPLKPKPLTPQRLVFNEKYGEMSGQELLQENLFAQQIQIEKLEKIRSNTSQLVWWLVAIPIIIVIIAFIFGLGI